MNSDKRLKRKVRSSYLVSTVSIALVLFLLGSVGHLTLAAVGAADALQRSIVVSVELQNDLSDELRSQLESRLSDDGMVGSIAFVSRDEKAQDDEFRKMFGGDFEEVLDENPLSDSFELTLTEASEEKARLEAFIAEAGRLTGVARVTYPALLAEQLHGTVGKLRLLVLLFGGALLAVSLILVHNTIRLAIFSKRYLINTMKLVGATRWFIMKPFLGSSLTQGILAGAVASVLFGAAVYGLNGVVPELAGVAEIHRIALILGAMMLGGILLSGLFTVMALNRFINMKSNKIYLY